MKKILKIIGSKITRAEYTDSPFHFVLETDNGVRISFNGVPLSRKRNISTELKKLKESLKIELITIIKSRRQPNSGWIGDVATLRGLVHCNSVYNTLFKINDFYLHYNGERDNLRFAVAKKWVEQNLCE